MCVCGEGGGGGRVSGLVVCVCERQCACMRVCVLASMGGWVHLHVLPVCIIAFIVHVNKWCVCVCMCVCVCVCVRKSMCKYYCVLHLQHALTALVEQQCLCV